MIQRIEMPIRRIRRFFSRAYWFMHWLGVSKFTPPMGDEHGILLIRIDGLSHQQLEKALLRNKMPFLKKLQKQEGYRLHSLYSGIPSTTPAVEAELFYGVTTAVPSFGFQHKANGEIFSMLSSTGAGFMQKMLEKQGAPLLAGGSVYSGIFTGGATQSHFCAASMGLSHWIRQDGFLGLFNLLVWNASSLFGLVFLAFLEFVLTLYDGLRGALPRGEFWNELCFSAYRSLVCEGLRDAITASACIDVARGLPIIHVNFVGYDEQAHRRGPSGKFAHFVLPRIDRSIRKLVLNARRSTVRDYDVWIYSDHGQEKSLPYVQEYGATVEQIIHRIFQGTARDNKHTVTMAHRPLWENIWGKTSKSENVAYNSSRYRSLTIVAPGPIGHIYFGEAEKQHLGHFDKEMIAKKLVQEGNIPLVFFLDANDTVMAAKVEGCFPWPLEMEKILGYVSPFSTALAEDVIRLCRHADAGDFIISGWRLQGLPITFAHEHGAHGGVGQEETHAFTLLPSNLFANFPRPFLRPLNLREEILSIIKHSSAPPPPLHDIKKFGLIMMTYNVHGCRGMDGKTSTLRIARVIAHYSPTVIALQECLPAKSLHSGKSQLEEIAEHLQAIYGLPHPLYWEQDEYENAFISIFPLRKVKAEALPGVHSKPNLRKRGAIQVTVELPDGMIHCINTHFGLVAQERVFQARALCGPKWLGNIKTPALICGDFNAPPWSSAYSILNENLKEVQENVQGHSPQGTLWGRFPLSRIDHIFYQGTLLPIEINIPRSHLTLLASDHLPVIAKFKI